MEKCEFCGTDEDITRHHLITREWRKKLGFKNGCEIMLLCWMHHRQVHHLATNKELSLIFNKKEKVIELLKGNKYVVINEHELDEILTVGVKIEIKKRKSAGMNHKEYALF